ncbi:MAG: hypothetical protein U1E42_11785 [Rhodospirillales bacterium]
MTPPNDAESALYADLTRLLQRMRGDSYAAVEAAVEERFQAFIRAHRAGASACLEITQTMTVHAEAEPWAIYRTEYRVKPAESLAAAGEIENVADNSYGNVVPFPAAFARCAAELAPEPACTMRTT